MSMKYVLSFFLLAASVLKAQTPISRSVNGLKQLDLFNVKMKSNVACYRIPALVVANNGDLIAAIDERGPSCADLKANENINIVMRKSRDNGKTWTDIRTLVDYPQGKSASDPSFINDSKTGTIFMFYNYMDLNKEKDIYYLHVLKSTDNGESWSEPADISRQVSKPEWHGDFKFITSGKGIQTASGVLLHTLVNLKHGVFVFGSNDHGKTWFLSDTPLMPADESKIIELKDGTWMVNSRVNSPGMRYVHISKNQGKSWTSRPEFALTDPACNAAIIRYKIKSINCLLFVNADSRDARKNLTIKVSYDEGETWTKGRTIYAGSAAYSDLVVMKNGNIGLLYEQNEYTENVFLSFPFRWIKD
jgi:sialidase-1